MSDTASPASSRVRRLALKELREILRDRRTITTLVLMPLLVYPLLGVMVKRGLLSSLETPGLATLRVAVDSEQTLQLFVTQMQAGQILLPQETPVRPEGDPLAELAAVTGAAPPKVDVYVLHEGTNPEDEVESGQADVAVRIEVSAISPAEQSASLTWTVYHRNGSQLSADAREYIRRRLEALNHNWMQQTLQLNHLPVNLPARLIPQAVESRDQRPSQLITFIPLVLVLMTMTGAVYPAIDLTAGERERGTMEILVAAPVSRVTLLFGKFVAVLTVALLTASVNMLSMFATLFTLGLDSSILGGAGVSMIPLVMLMMVVFAGFFSAVLLSITSVARSFKEAQAYLIPLMLISLTPGIFSLMPDLQMGPLLSVTPLVNIVLMGRDLLLGNFRLLTFATVILSTGAWGLLALVLAARVFGSDSVLYGSSGSWSALFRKPDQPRQHVPLSAAMFALGLVFPLFIVLGTVPSRLQEAFQLSMSQLLLCNIPVFLVVFAGVPLVATRLSGVSVRSGLSLSARVPWGAVVVAVLLGGAMWALLHEVTLLVGFGSMSTSLKESLKSLMEGLDTVPLIVKLAALAVAPAICEELFFRGFLQRALRQRLSAWQAVAASALLFGLFHIVVRDALFLERMIPSTLMGILLGWLLERSGSVLPGMLLHVLHNGLLLCLAHYRAPLQQMGIGVEQEVHLPWLVLGPAATAVGVALVVLRGTQPPASLTANATEPS